MFLKCYSGNAVGHTESQLPNATGKCWYSCGLFCSFSLGKVKCITFKLKEKSLTLIASCLRLCSQSAHYPSTDLLAGRGMWWCFRHSAPNTSRGSSVWVALHASRSLTSLLDNCLSNNFILSHDHVFKIQKLILSWFLSLKLKQAGFCDIIYM